MGLLSGCGTVSVRAAGEGGGPVLSTTIDFLDYCWTEADPEAGYFTEAQYDEVIRSLAEAGIGKVYLRVDVCGLTLYPTKVGKQYAGDGREPGSTNLVNTLAKYDPVAKTIELCRKYGLEVWCWDTLFDDVATGLRYDPVTDRAKFEAYGEYPLMDPFLIENPHLQWAIDPRLKKEQAERFARTVTEAGPITAIRITSDSDKSNRVAREQFDLYVSADNRVFRRYDKPFAFTVVSARPTTLQLEGLDIVETYLKLAWRAPWPKERSGFSVSGDPGKLVQVRHGDVWHSVHAVYRDEEGDPEQGGGDFRQGQRFAWDWGSRSLVIAKCLPPAPEYYGIVELAYPAAKAHKLAKLRELAKYGFDGFAYSMRTHTRGTTDGYGYNDVVRDEFLRRYGKDIWKDDFDRAKWQSLRAEAVNEYLAMASRALAPRPLYMDWPATGPGTDSQRRWRYTGRYGEGFPWQVDQWVRDGSVTGVRVVSCSWDQPVTLGVPGADSVRLARFVDNWRLPPVDEFRDNLRRWFANERLDEVELYETVMYTKQPAYLQAIREVMDELAEKAKAAE